MDRCVEQMVTAPGLTELRPGHSICKINILNVLHPIVVALKGNVLPELVRRSLAEMGVSLNVGLQVPHILAAPIIVAKSNYLVTLPSRVARTYTEFLDLKLFKTPFAFPSYEVSLVWHERAHRDPASIWLRKFLKDVCKTI